MKPRKKKETKNSNVFSSSRKSMQKKQTIQCLICAGAIAFFILMSTSVSATVIVYDNTTTSSSSLLSMAGYFGDEISLGPGPRNVVEFRFDYDLYLSQYEDTVGNETATIKFYQNNGSGGAPGTVLYNSGPFSISSGYHTQTLSIPNILVPDTFTWMVLFEGVYQGNSSGPSIPSLVEFDPPTVGSSDHFFWNEWTPGSYTKVPSDYNFNARVTATPIPATMLLLGSGLIGLAGFRCKRKE